MKQGKKQKVIDVIITESQLKYLHGYIENMCKGNIATNMVNEEINEHKHLSDIADKEFYDIAAEFHDVFDNDNYISKRIENVHGVDIPLKIFIVEGYYSIDDNETEPKLESAKVVFFFVYYLNHETKPIYDAYVNKTSTTREDGAIKLVLSALNGKIDDNDFERAMSTLPHEQIHAIQKNKTGNKPIDKNYVRATEIRHSDKSEIRNSDKLLSKMMWYFDKKEIDANIHKFIVDYRDVLDNNEKIDNCPLFQQILTMVTLIDSFESINKNEMEQSLKQYGLRWSKYLKHCKHLLNYVQDRFEKVKKYVEDGEYPYPGSKDKWFGGN